MQSHDVVLIRGAPGIGKSTIGELLRVAAPNGAIVDIDKIRRMLNKERFIYNENHEYRNATIAAGALVKSFLSSKYSPVVVIDVFSKPILELFINQMQGHSLISIILHADDEVLSARMTNRTNGYINVDVARRVSQHIYDTRSETDFMIDTTLLGPHDVLRCVLDLLDYRSLIQDKR